MLSLHTQALQGWATQWMIMQQWIMDGRPCDVTSKAKKKLKAPGSGPPVAHGPWGLGPIGPCVNPGLYHRLIEGHRHSITQWRIKVVPGSRRTFFTGPPWSNELRSRAKWRVNRVACHCLWCYTIIIIPLIISDNDVTTAQLVSV